MAVKLVFQHRAGNGKMHGKVVLFIRDLVWKSGYLQDFGHKKRAF